MSNLYEILEVSEKASKEIIDKAYRVLAKKYHPDLQKQEEKQEAEKKMKQINEAYEILSNEEKRKEYDAKLVEERERIRAKENQKIQQAEASYKQTYVAQEEMKKARKQRKSNNNDSYQNARKIQKEIDQAYTQAYRNYVRSLRI